MALAELATAEAALAALPGLAGTALEAGAADRVLLAGEVDRRAVAQAVAAFGDHSLAALQAAGDRHGLAGARTGGHGDLVGDAVCAHGKHIVALRAVAHGGGGDDHGVAQHIHQHADVDELVGEQGARAIVEAGLGLDRAGRGVDHVVERRQLTLGQGGAAAAVEHRGRQGRARTLAAGDLGQVVLGDREHHVDRVDLGDHQQGLAGGADVVAHVHQAQAHAAGHRGGDPGVLQVQLGVVDVGLVGLDRAFVLLDQGVLGVDLLRGDGVLRTSRV